MTDTTLYSGFLAPPLGKSVSMGQTLVARQLLPSEWELSQEDPQSICKQASGSCSHQFNRQAQACWSLRAKLRSPLLWKITPLIEKNHRFLSLLFLFLNFFLLWNIRYIRKDHHYDIINLSSFIKSCILSPSPSRNSPLPFILGNTSTEKNLEWIKLLPSVELYDCPCWQLWLEQ